MASEATEAEAMRQLAHHGAGYELLCEGRLARSGKPFGFAPAEAPEWASAVQCGLSVCMALGPSMGPDCMLPAGELVKASAKFLKAAPSSPRRQQDKIVEILAPHHRGQAQGRLRLKPVVSLFAGSECAGDARPKRGGCWTPQNSRRNHQHDRRDTPPSCLRQPV
jgi:hypothetical protein